MYSIDKINDLLKLPLSELMTSARDAKLRARGDSFSLCTIMNVKSGRCTEDCAFCAQSSRYGTGSPVFALKSTDEILEAAAKAKDAGAGRFSLVTSGSGLSMSEVDELAVGIEQIRTGVGISVCASFGILDSFESSTAKLLKLLALAVLCRSCRYYRSGYRFDVWFHYDFFAISRVLPTVPRMRLSCIFCTWFPLRRSEDRGHSIRWVTFHPVFDKILW